MGRLLHLSFRWPAFYVLLSLLAKCFFLKTFLQHFLDTVDYCFNFENRVLSMRMAFYLFFQVIAHFSPLWPFRIGVCVTLSIKMLVKMEAETTFKKQEILHVARLTSWAILEKDVI